LTDKITYPYIPNSTPEIKKQLLEEIGVKDVMELYEDIPEKFLLNRRLNIPKPSSEYEVRRHVGSLLAKNESYNDILCFMGAGCWPHYVPAVCDEIIGRAEFLTSYAGDTYTDLGRHQAVFEFQSMIGDLFEMDVVSWPMYDWATVCGEAARMASRVTGRYEVLVPEIIDPDRLSVMKNYCGDLIDIKFVSYDSETGQLDVEDMKNKISSKTAGVYIENPSYLGFIEAEGEEISKITHEHEALSIVGVEPTSLGILEAPGNYGADIVIADGQPLGNHMNFGGSGIGIISCKDEERLIMEMPTLLNTITTTDKEGEYGFSLGAFFERVFYYAREKGKSPAGSSSTLLGISGAVYMALLGPKGMRELGESIMYKSNYAMKLISEIEGVKTPLFGSTHFEEFTVNFDGTRKTVKEVNKELMKHGIQGGKDVSKEFPQLGETALYCVTEIHTKEDIEKLSTSLEEVLR
jgi:glycine dehydrogenase subunit 1